MCPKNLTRKLSHMKKVVTFQIWKEKSLCRKKKFCNQNQYLKKKNLVLRVWFALLNYKKTHNNPEFQLPTFFHQFSYFVKNQIKFPFQMSKYKKNEKKTQPCVYIKKEEKRNQKNFYCSCCCNLTKKKLSLKLYMCKLFLKGNLPKVVENQYLLDVLLPIISQKKK